MYDAVTALEKNQHQNNVSYPLFSLYNFDLVNSSTKMTVLLLEGQQVIF